MFIKFYVCWGLVCVFHTRSGSLCALDFTLFKIWCGGGLVRVLGCVVGCVFTLERGLFEDGVFVCFRF